MKRIVICMVIGMLVFTTVPLTVEAGDENDPEVTDPSFDVKLLGLIPFPFQSRVKSADFTSVWFYEEESDPDVLFISMKLRDLASTTDTFDNIYVVHWRYGSDYYSASVHAMPAGPTPFLAGKSDTEGNDYVSYVICDGSFDTENNIISWSVPKEGIGDPEALMRLTDITPSTHIRYPQGSGKPRFDLFKDLPWNAEEIKDYTIQY